MVLSLLLDLLDLTKAPFVYFCALHEATRLGVDEMMEGWMVGPLSTPGPPGPPGAPPGVSSILASHPRVPPLGVRKSSCALHSSEPPTRVR